MSARGLVDNYIVKVQCGRCAHLWHDGLRYQDETIVRCPNCEARNNVDSSGVTVSNQQGKQVVTSSHAITDKSWRDPGPEDELEIQLAGVDQAITTCRDAVATTPPEHPHRHGRLCNLGLALNDRFERTGQLADLDYAVTAGRNAVIAIPSHHLRFPGYLANLAATLRVRFEHTGQQTDLDEAIATGREAVGATSPDHPDHFACRATLGLALQERFGCTGHLADLEEAVTAFMDAVAAIHPITRTTRCISTTSAVRCRPGSNAPASRPIWMGLLPLPAMR